MHTALNPYVQNINFSGELEQDIRAFFAAHNEEETLAHVLAVAAEAKRVAKLYGADPGQAEQAALLHDISNVVPVKEMLALAEQLSIEILPEEYSYGRIVHQKLSRSMAEQIFRCENQEILAAIECHTTLKAQATLLDKVLFISDKISWELPGDHPYLTQIRERVDALQLEDGILIYLDYIWEQRTKLKLVHPWLIEAREERVG